jgi:hypothetical protein
MFYSNRPLADLDTTELLKEDESIFRNALYLMGENLATSLTHVLDQNRPKAVFTASSGNLKR